MEDVAAAIAIVGIVVLIVAAAILSRMVKVVPQHRVGLVERLGRYRRTIEPGLSLVAPFVDQVRTVDTSEHAATFASLACTTADHYPMAAEVTLRLRVTDPVAATYEVADYLTALEELTGSTLRNLVGALPVARARAAHHELTQQLRDAVGTRAPDWGVQVTRLEITSLEPR